MSENSFWAWFAGFWEGEGHFRVNYLKNPRWLKVEFAVSNTNPEPIRLVHEKLGVGHIGVEKSKNHSNWKPKYRWGVCRRHDVLNVVRRILPFLTFRKNEVEEKLNFLMNKGRWRTRYSKEDEEFIRRNLNVMSDRQMAKELNRSYHALRCFRLRIGLKRVKGGILAEGEQP